MRHFFFYGTLVAGSGTAASRAIHRHLEPGRPGIARGTLHAVRDETGWYPALLPGDGVVHGMVHAAPADVPAADLAALDAYEQYWPDDPARSEYLRRPIVVEVAGEVIAADAYLYNAPLPVDARLVPDGDFRAFLLREGLPQYRGTPRRHHDETAGKDDLT